MAITGPVGGQGNDALPLDEEDHQDDSGMRLKVRIAVLRYDDGRVEFALQQQRSSGWSPRVLTQSRFVPTDAAEGRWLHGPPMALPAAVLRVAARRHSEQRIEFALQQLDATGAWGSYISPKRRLFPAGSTSGHWLVTTPMVLAASSGAASMPTVLITSTGVPVAVLEAAGEEFTVRTPCGATAAVAGGEPLEQVQIVLDPGHGGPSESGAVGPNGLYESRLNLRLSEAILQELARRGITAAATRTGDYGMLLSTRAEIGNVLATEALISLHHNAPTARISTLPGSEVYVQSTPQGEFRADSARLGGLLYEAITRALAAFEGIRWSRLPNAGVLRVLSSDGDDLYGMIRRPKVPAVLVEYGYLSNAPEAALFATKEYIRVAAAATADAIEAYLNTKRSGSGFIPQPRVFDPPPTRLRCSETPLE